MAPAALSKMQEEPFLVFRIEFERYVRLESVRVAPYPTTRERMHFLDVAPVALRQPEALRMLPAPNHEEPRTERRITERTGHPRKFLAMLAFVFRHRALLLPNMRVRQPAI